MSNYRDSYILCENFLKVLDDLEITTAENSKNNFVDTDEFYRVLTGIEVDDDE